MAVCPFAKQKLIAPGSNDPRIQARVAILHVAVSMAASLFAFFRDRSGGIESHFYITWTGKIEQYRDTAYQADANYLANDFAVSIETAGFGTGKWNRRQLRAIKRLLIWLRDVEGIPLQRCPQWNGAGVGYHIQFGSPGMWTNVSKSCPGPERIRQFERNLVPWMRRTRKAPAPATTPLKSEEDWFDMATEKQLENVVRRVVDEKLSNGYPDVVPVPSNDRGVTTPDNSTWTIRWALSRIWRLTKDNNDKLAALTKEK